MLNFFYSLGETLSTRIFLELLWGEKFAPSFIDSREIITSYLDGDESFIDWKRSLFRSCEGLGLTQGFIARNYAKETTSLGREGSDLSASFLAYQYDVDLLEIWTDSAGVYPVDPRLSVLGEEFASLCLRPIPFLSYESAELFSSLGAKVIYWKTLAPARVKNIPIQIAATGDPFGPKTLIGNFSESFSFLGPTLISDCQLLSGEIVLSGRIYGLEEGGSNKFNGERGDLISIVLPKRDLMKRLKVELQNALAELSNGETRAHLNILLFSSSPVVSVFLKEERITERPSYPITEAHSAIFRSFIKTIKSIF